MITIYNNLKNSDQKTIQGKIRLMPSENRENFPDMILSFTEPILRMGVSDKSLKVNCWNGKAFCTISQRTNKALKRNKMVSIPVKIFVDRKSDPLLVGMKWNGQDVCETKPEPHP